MLEGAAVSRNNCYLNAQMMGGRHKKGEESSVNCSVNCFTDLTGLASESHSSGTPQAILLDNLISKN